MEDTQILQLLWSRAEQALEALARKFGHRLYRLAMNILTDPLDAEESVNDTYLALWNAIPPARPDPLAGYVYRVGRNTALNHLRSRSAQCRDSRYDLSLDELAEIIPDSYMEETLNAKALGQAIDRYLDSVTKENRILFLRRYWFGDPVKVIAADCGLSENVLSVRLHRLRAGLKAYLYKEGVFDEA